MAVALFHIARPDTDGRTDGHDEADLRVHLTTKHTCIIHVIANYVSPHLEIKWCGHNFYYE